MEVGLEHVFTSSSKGTVAHSVVGWQEQSKAPGQKQRVNGAGPFCQAIRDTLKQLEMAGDAWSERVGHAECRKQAQQEHRAVHKIARSRS